MEKRLCRTKIEENIINVETGKPLTMPLRELNESCDFVKIWNKFNEADIKKEYNQKPEVKKYRKEYRQRPEVKLKQKEYYQRPEVKLKQKEYRQRPEVKLKQKKYYQRKKNEK